MSEYALRPEDILVVCNLCGRTGTVSFAGGILWRGECTCNDDVFPLEFMLRELPERVRGETIDALGQVYEGRSWS